MSEEQKKTFNKPITMVPVVSSNIHSVGFNNKKKELIVEFKVHSRYSYKDVAPEVYDAMLQAESKGKYFAEFVRGKYEALCIKQKPPKVVVETTTENTENAKI